MKTKKFTGKASRLLENLKALAITCSLSLPMAGSAALAQYSYDTYEPQIASPVQELFMGNTVQTQQEGQMQMTVGASHQRDNDLRNTELRGRMEVGITDRLQGQAELPLDITDRSAGFTAQSDVRSIDVGLTYSILRAEDPVSVSAALDVDIPIGDRPDRGTTRMTQTGTIWKPQLIVGGNMGPVQLHSNAQAELSGSDEQAVNYSVGALTSFGAFSPSLEVSGRSMMDQRSEYYLTPGMYYSFSNRAQLGLGVPVGLNDESKDGQIMAKFNFQF